MTTTAPTLASIVGVLSAWVHGNREGKIQAIKAVRNLSGGGLRESKLLVEGTMSPEDFRKAMHQRCGESLAFAQADVERLRQQRTDREHAAVLLEQEWLATVGQVRGEAAILAERVKGQDEEIKLLRRLAAAHVALLRERGVRVEDSAI